MQNAFLVLLGLLGPQYKHFDAALQTLLTRVKLQLQHCL